MSKKKFIISICTFAVAVAIAFVFIIMNSKNSSAAYADGTWRGESEGRNGLIEISITTMDGAIISGSIISECETDFAKPAIRDILDQAISKGNINSYDVVSGCTISSNATAEAIKDALSKAAE